MSKILEPIWLPQSLIYKFKAAINSGQKGDFFLKKGHFFEKKAPKISSQHIQVLSIK